MRTEAQQARAELARKYVHLLRSRGISNPGEIIGTYFNATRVFFGDKGADNNLKEVFESEDENQAKAG